LIPVRRSASKVSSGIAFWILAAAKAGPNGTCRSTADCLAIQLLVQTSCVAQQITCQFAPLHACQKHCQALSINSGACFAIRFTMTAAGSIVSRTFAFKCSDRVRSYSMIAYPTSAFEVAEGKRLGSA
jgi:hypothetical protein